MLRILRGFNFPASSSPVVATIGKFDGIHLGHQKLLSDLFHTKQNSGLKSVVVSFYSNPAFFFNPKLPKKNILSLFEKIEILNEFEVDYLLLLRFNKRLMEITADRFIQHFLVDKLNVKKLLVGKDATIGKDRIGNTEYLKKHLDILGRDLVVSDLIEQNGLKISSSSLREAILKGDFLLYQRLTNRPYAIVGNVVLGRQLGRTIGFPTANVQASKVILPPLGVYASNAVLGGKRYLSVTNIGYRPTVNDSSKEIKIETYLIDYTGGDFYNQKIKIELLSFLREEQRFLSLAELKAQIKVDLETRLKLS